MRRVTKENLIVQIDRLYKIKNEQGQLSMNGEYTLQAYEMLLATMEAEPVDEVYAELYRLREEVKGPDGFNTWRDAAIAEKKARVELERQINQSGRDIDYLGAMAAFHSNEWHKMDPITGYMRGWNARRNHAQTAPVVSDDVSIFEAAIEKCKTCDSIDEYAWNHGVLAVIAEYESCRGAMLNQK